MSFNTHTFGIVAIAITALCAIYSARQVYRDRTRYNDARLMCLCGLLVLMLPMVVSITGPARIATGTVAIIAVLYGILNVRAEYAKTLHGSAQAR